MTNIKPLNNNLFLEAIEEEKITESGIVLPDTSEKQRPVRGRVIAVGPGSKNDQGQVIRVPIAHMDGNYFADEATLDRLEGEGRVAFRYCAKDGQRGGGGANEQGPGANPNGSARDIAGILNDSRSVLGMMPHPERLADPALGGNDGRAMFDGLVRTLG